ncbi:MAG: DMT family transporter [Sedimentitalea sp.]
MTRRAVAINLLILVALGAGWGATQPLTKVAVSTGYQYMGLIFWQLMIGAVATGAAVILGGKGLPRTPGALWTYAVIAIIGTVLPNSASYQAITHLPVGIHAILMSLIPMAAFPVALLLRLERFSPLRFLGILLGLAGVSLLVLPEASLPDRAMLLWVPVSLVSVLCYACEGNYVARWGTAGLDPLQVMCGASIFGALLSLPIALGTGQFISPVRAFGAPEWAFVAASLIHVLVYTGYVWLVGRAGPVFAVQVSYLVTGFGVLFAMVFLGESYSPYFWIAAALVLGGVFLVQPRAADGALTQEST